VLEQNGQLLSGVAQGVDKNGGLLLETETSAIQVFHSAEVSIQRD
jgi:biotin-(acetyl-CoA carboxylase) ligase